MKAMTKDEEARLLNERIVSKTKLDAELIQKAYGYISTAPLGAVLTALARRSEQEAEISRASADGHMQRSRPENAKSDADLPMYSLTKARNDLDLAIARAETARELRKLAKQIDENPDLRGLNVSGLAERNEIIVKSNAYAIPRETNNAHS